MPSLDLMNLVPGSELQDRLLRKSKTVAEENLGKSLVKKGT
jgi:hypothetical protein